ncbi:MAG: hypothetical protein AB7I27_07035 [Bacteriovoracaceae bacterium]
MITTEQMDALVASKYALLASNEIFKNNEADVKEGLREEINSLTELALPDVCRKRCDFFKLSGTRPEDYRERIIEVPGKGFLLAGIRFRGLDVTKPFVSVIPSFITTENDLTLIKELIKEEFRVFRPQAFQLTLSPKYLRERVDILEDRFTVAGKIDSILREKLCTEVKIELVATSEIDFYERYVQEYLVFHEQRPELKLEVRSESLDDLNESLKSNLLYKIMINDEFAGVIAGAISNYHGISGASVLEELLFSTFRGKKLGVHVQYEFAKKLKGRFEVLWGTISPKNQSSLKTALKNQRKITETDYFISTDERGFYEQ